MKVKELIKKLKELPEDEDVYVAGAYASTGDVLDVEHQEMFGFNPKGVYLISDIMSG